MILALLHLTVGLGQVPSVEPVPSAIRGADVTASVQLSETHFQARSLVGETQWLVFSNPTRGLLRIRGLGPFERALLPVEEGGADGMSIELLARGRTGAMLSTGTLRCEALAGETVFLERELDTISGWCVRHEGRALDRMTGRRSARTAQTAPLLADPLHVPLPLPSENRKSKKSRKIKPKKLPPY